jgi:hypothetical protein
MAGPGVGPSSPPAVPEQLSMIDGYRDGPVPL